MASHWPIAGAERFFGQRGDNQEDALLNADAATLLRQRQRCHKAVVDSLHERVRQPAEGAVDQVFTNGKQIFARDERRHTQPGRGALDCGWIDQETRRLVNVTYSTRDLRDNRVVQTLIVMIRLDYERRPQARRRAVRMRKIDENDIPAADLHG
jgi:hypothetical protein